MVNKIKLISIIISNQKSHQMAAPGGGDMNEIHTKMSKKIAQLTKVIYQLNTKNEDTESKLKHLQEKHKSELDAIQSGTVNQSELDELTIKFDQCKNQLAETNSRLNEERLAKSSHEKNIQILKSEVDIERSLREKIELEYSAAKNSWQLERKSIGDDQRKRSELERVEAARLAQVYLYNDFFLQHNYRKLPKTQYLKPRLKWNKCEPYTHSS